jgi:hypothetical protein
VALSQNSSQLAVVPFIDHVLARFEAPVDVLTHQLREFLGSFEELCTKVLINHCITYRNHHEASGWQRE